MLNLFDEKNEGNENLSAVDFLTEGGVVAYAAVLVLLLTSCPGNTGAE